MVKFLTYLKRDKTQSYGAQKQVISVGYRRESTETETTDRDKNTGIE